MDILVLGGTGWLGREIATAALAAGHDVTCMARGATGAPPDGVRWVTGDRDGDGTGSGASSAAYGRLGSFDVAVDVARDPGHVRGAVAALADRVGHWVLISSCSVYAAHDTPGADESAALLPALVGPWSMDVYGEGKVSCEQAVLGAGPERASVLRSGLVAGPGDVTDRTGYWPLRFAHPALPDGSVLVPDVPAATTQVVDVRDLAAFALRCGTGSVAGVFNVASAPVPLAEHLATARDVAGHDGALVPVSQDWLLAHDVQPWSGPRSLPVWLPVPEYAGFMARDTSAAFAAGLVCRPLADTLADALAWELGHGPGRARLAGLAPTDEIGLVAAADR